MKSMTNMNPTDLFGREGVAVVEKYVEKTKNVSKDMELVISMTPKDGYQKKIELISEAEDMTTEEKTQAIDAAENKYAEDLEKSFELLDKVRWSNVIIILLCAAGIALTAYSPSGRRITREILRVVA